MNSFINVASDVLAYLRDFNIGSILFRIVLSAVLSGIVGMERSKSGRAAGLRTHILVSLGATIAAMTGLYINYRYGNGDVSRIAAQVISGIGFLGAGTILVKNKLTVTGLTTAACVWTTGAIGIAVGYGFYEAAIFGTVLIFYITDKLTALDNKFRNNKNELAIYFECLDAKKLNETLNKVRTFNFDIDTVNLEESKTKLTGSIGVELLVHVDRNENVEKMISEINEIDNINFAIVTTK